MNTAPAWPQNCQAQYRCENCVWAKPTARCLCQHWQRLAPATGPMRWPKSAGNAGCVCPSKLHHQRGAAAAHHPACGAVTQPVHGQAGRALQNTAPARHGTSQPCRGAARGGGCRRFSCGFRGLNWPIAFILRAQAAIYLVAFLTG